MKYNHDAMLKAFASKNYRRIIKNFETSLKELIDIKIPSQTLGSRLRDAYFTLLRNIKSNGYIEDFNVISFKYKTGVRMKIKVIVDSVLRLNFELSVIIIGTDIKIVTVYNTLK